MTTVWKVTEGPDPRLVEGLRLSEHTVEWPEGRRMCVGDLPLTPQAALGSALADAHHEEVKLNIQLQAVRRRRAALERLVGK